jgi:hypothetical protein
MTMSHSVVLVTTTGTVSGRNATAGGVLPGLHRTSRADRAGPAERVGVR